MTGSIVAITTGEGRATTSVLGDSDRSYVPVAPSGARHLRMKYRHLSEQTRLASGYKIKTCLTDACVSRDRPDKVLSPDRDPTESIILDRITVSVPASA